MIKNFTKQKLQDEKHVLGTFLVLNSPCVAEVLSHAGFDFLIIDMEHGMISIETAGLMINSMKGTNVTPFIRIPVNSPVEIKQALDAGAYGIMVPMVNSKEDAQLAVRSCHYPALGIRGVGAGHASLYGLNMEEYISNIEKEIMVMVQIETEEGVLNIEEIASVPGIDIIFIGPTDLASSLGVIGQNNSEKLHDAIKKVLDVCKKYNKKIGIFCFTSEEIVKYASMGFSFLGLGLDSSFLLTSAVQAIDGVKKHIKE